MVTASDDSTARVWDPAVQLHLELVRRTGRPLAEAEYVDRKAPQSPRGTQVVAEIPNLFGPGFTAQMTYYETPQGAKVFAAGAFTLAGAVLRGDVRPVMENLWDRLARP